MATTTVTPTGGTPTTSSKSLFKKILVALDGSENSIRASQAALELAEKLKADLIVFHAIIPPALYYHTEISPEGPVIEPPTHERVICTLNMLGELVVALLTGLCLRQKNVASRSRPVFLRQLAPW